MVKNFIFTLLVTFSSYNQQFAQEFDVLSYNKTINSAELLIVRGSLNEAIVHYEIALKKVGFLLNKDLYNLCVCHLKKCNISTASNLIYSLICNGAKRNVLLQNKLIFNNFSNTEINQTISTNFSNSLHDSLNMIFKNDQIYRTSIYKNSNNTSLIWQADSINNMILLKIIRDYNGLPSEKITGIGSNSFIFQEYLIHILHQSFGSAKYDYANVILEALTKGNINAHLGAFLFTRVTGNQFYFGPLSLISIRYDNNSQLQKDSIDFSTSRNTYILKLDSVKKKKCDENRKLYGLESIDEFVEKAKFQIANPEFEFYYLPFINSNYIFNSKADLEKVTKNLIRLY